MNSGAQKLAWRASAIKVKKVTKRFKYFEAGEPARLILTEFRNSGGKLLSIPEIATALMRHKGLDPEHHPVFKAVAHRVQMQLHKLDKRGVLLKIGSHAGVQWRLPEEGD
jgi:hypothetical protein